jgi:L-ascorbate metabolism protein UlaG (beta-lactamase superfamily)
MLKDLILSTQLCDNQLAVFYLGQEGILFKYNGKYVLIDGYLSDYVDQNCCSENVKWVRKYAPPIKPQELDFVDYIFCTHSHFDHTDPWTLSEINKVNKTAKYIASAAFSDILTEYGIEKDRIIPAFADKEIVFDEIKAMPVPAAHEQLNIDESGNFCELGFLLTFGNIKAFHAGDCCVYDGLCERINGTDIAFLPINGRDYFRLNNDIIGNMDSREAVLLAKAAGIDVVVPMHFDLYEVNEVNPAHFVDTLYALNSCQKFHIFMPGERFIYHKS